MNKRAGIVALLLVGGLTGCGSNQPVDVAGNVEPDTVPTTTISMKEARDALGLSADLTAHADLVRNDCAAFENDGSKPGPPPDPNAKFLNVSGGPGCQSGVVRSDDVSRAGDDDLIPVWSDAKATSTIGYFHPRGLGWFTLDEVARPDFGAQLKAMSAEARALHIAFG